MFRDKTLDEVLSYKYLLLGIVRLIHADPNLMLNVCTSVRFFSTLCGFNLLLVASRLSWFLTCLM